MDNYNDINNEDNIVNQEQPNGGSLSNGIDPQAVAEIAARIEAGRGQVGNDRPNLNNNQENEEDEEQKKKDGGNNLAQGAKKGIDEVNKSGEKAASNALKNEAAKKGLETAGANAVGTGAAAAGTAGATTAATGAASAGAGTGIAALLANPITWIVLGIIVLLLLAILVYIAVDMTEERTSWAEATGVPQSVIDSQCDEENLSADDLEKCLKMTHILNGKETEDGTDYSEGTRLYYKLYEYCADTMTFGQKLGEKIRNLFHVGGFGSECEITRFVESTLKKKEDEIKGKYSNAQNFQLSRGLVVGTLQHLYDGSTIIKEDGKETDETSSYNYVDGSDADSVFKNILKDGAITRDDIIALVDNMVFEKSYTFYTWKEETEVKTEKIPQNRINELGNKIYQYSKDEDGNYVWNVTYHKYSCEPIEEKKAGFSRDKYFLFLRFGGSYDEENDKWIQTKVTNGVIEKSDKLDAVTSYQELTSYNESWDIASEECRSGEYSSLSNSENPNQGSKRQENTDTDKYVYDESIDIADHAYPFKGNVDTTKYAGNLISSDEEIYTPQQVSGLSSSSDSCKINNVTSVNDSTCELRDDFTLDYRNGFVYIKFAQFKTYMDEAGIDDQSISDEEYDYMSETIENNIRLVRVSEDELNDLFGFEYIDNTDISYYAGITVGLGSFCTYQNKPIRIVTSRKATADALPGGASYINGVYVANETMTMEEFIKNITYAEIGGYLREQYIEAVKFNMIAIKSVILSDDRYSSSRVSEKNGELYVKIDSFVAYKSAAGLDSRYKNILDSAYSSIKDVLLYEKGTQTVFHSLYGASLQDRTAELALTGLNYKKILAHSRVQEYYKDETSHYSNAEFGNCSTVISNGGTYNGNVDTKWPFFPAGTSYRVSTKSMFICRLNDGRPDFHAAVDLPVAAGTQITCPIDGVVISSNYYGCGNGIVKIESTLPGGQKAILQFTHLYRNGLISNGSIVKANQTVVGYISDGSQDSCSSGSHLDFKAYNAVTKKYYNPSIFVAGILSGSTNIPTSDFIVGYNGGDGPEGYDRCCSGRIGNYPQC